MEVRTSIRGIQENAAFSQATMLNIEDKVQESTALLSASATRSDVAEMKMMMLAMMSPDAREVFRAMVSRHDSPRTMRDDTTIASQQPDQLLNVQHSTVSVQSSQRSSLCSRFECRCPARRMSKRRKRRFGPAFLQQETTVEGTHFPVCAFAGFGAHTESSWTAGMSLKIFQALVSTAIKVSISSEFGYGGLGISPSLTVYNVRETSPAFSIMSLLRLASAFGSGKWTDEESTAIVLRATEAMKKSFSEGKSSPFDINVCGNTLLHVELASCSPLWAELWNFVFGFLIKARVPRDRPNGMGRYSQFLRSLFPR